MSERELEVEAERWREALERLLDAVTGDWDAREELEAKEQARAALHPARAWMLYICHSCGYGATEDENDFSCPRCGEVRAFMEQVQVQEVRGGEQVRELASS